jgi:hypothetical protein
VAMACCQADRLGIDDRRRYTIRSTDTGRPLWPNGQVQPHCGAQRSNVGCNLLFGRNSLFYCRHWFARTF